MAKTNRTKYLAIVLFILGLAVLFSLGAWQLNRGFEKRSLEQVLTQRGQQYTEIYREPKTWDPLAHQLVKIRGNWIANKDFLLANRVFQSSIGYEVYSPFRLMDGSIVMVNKGWISVGEGEDYGFDTDADEIGLSGHIYTPKLGFTLGESIINTDAWPIVMQYFDVEAVSEAIGETVAPAVLVLDENSVFSHARLWVPSVMKSSKHFGYAFQWLALALTLIIFGFIWNKQSSSKL